MSYSNAWMATIHRANVDTVTKPYTTVALATISAFTGYATQAVYIIAPQRQWDFQVEEYEAVSGDKIAIPTRRMFYDLISYPFTYDDGIPPDLTDIDTIANFISDPTKFYWLSVAAGSRTYPSANNVQPVTLVEWAENINMEAGNRTLRMRWDVRSRS